MPVVLLVKYLKLLMLSGAQQLVCYPALSARLASRAASKDEKFELLCIYNLIVLLKHIA